MKKFILISVLFFLVAPVAAFAYDFGTAGIVAGLAGAGVGLGLLFGAVPAMATVAIGAAVMGVVFPNSGGETSSADSPSMAVQLAPAAEKTPPPEPSTTAPFDTKFPNYPSTTPYLDTAAAYCEAFRSAGGYLSVRNVVENPYPQTSTCQVERTQVAGGGFFTISVNVVRICPSGYSQSSGVCTLTDPAQVPKPPDGVCLVVRVGNSFSVDSTDPDCAKKPATVEVQPNFVQQKLPDGSTKTVMINPDGSATATEAQPNAASKTTETNTTKYSAPDSEGAVFVTGQASGITDGTGTADTGNPVPVFDKSGLATEGTLGGIKGDTAAIKDALTGEGSDSSLGDQKSAFDAAVDGLIGMFGSEAGKSSGIDDDFSVGGFLPAQCGCTPLTIDYKGHHASFDWCGPIDTFKNIFAWAIGLLTAFYVLSLFRVSGGK